MKNKEYFFNTDGQLKSERFDDVYFSNSGAEEESKHVFINTSRLPERFSSNTDFTVAEAGFGTGLNFLQTLRLWQQHFNQKKELTYYAFEKTPLPTDILEQIYKEWQNLTDVAELFLSRYTEHNLKAEKKLKISLPEYNTKLIILTGDINDTIQEFKHKVNAWYLDGFSPSKNPQMWSETLFKSMSANSIPQETTVTTYSCARAVREGLQQNNFEIEKVAGFGKKKHMLYGIYST